MSITSSQHPTVHEKNCETAVSTVQSLLDVIPHVEMDVDVDIDMKR